MTSTLNARLLRAFQMTDADLEANRAGELTRNQREHLKPTQSQALVQAVLWGHLIVIGGLLGIITLLTGETILLLICGAVIVLGIMPFTVLRTSSPKLRNDLLAGDLETITGAVEITRGRDKDQSYRVKITNGEEKMSFRITRKQASAFQKGTRHTLYYLPTSRLLVLAEAHENPDS